MRTYGSIEKMHDGWRITEIEPHVRIRLKSVFRGIEKTASPPYELRGSASLDADIDWFLSRYPLEITTADKAILSLGKQSFYQKQDEIERILSGDWQPGKTDFKEGLAPYPYQAQAAELAQRTGRLLIMDDVGLGKTITALAAIASKEFLPAAIVVQPHLAEQWQRDYIDKFSHLSSHIIKGTQPYELPYADIYIFKYSNIAGWSDYFEQIQFKAVVYDEIQELRRGTETQKGCAAKILTDIAQLKIGLSATPIFNYGPEMFNIMQYIEPDCLGDYYSFIIEWCTSQNNHWVVADPQALGTYLVEQNLVIRRTEDDVDSQLPPVNVIMHEVEYDQETAAESEALARQLAITATTGNFHERGQATRELDALARHTTGVAKAKGVAAFVRILLEAGEKILLAGWHRDVYAIWQKELAAYNPLLYTGSETARKKDATKQAFINGETDIIFMSLRSGAGLDGLQHVASTVAFGEFDWSPQVHKQLIGRLRRPGQLKRVDTYYLYANDGSDPVLLDTIGLKASQSHGIVDPLKAAPTQFTDQSRLQKLAQTYLDKMKGAA